MEITLHIDKDCISIFCECGEELKGNIEIDEAGDATIIIEPCTACQEHAIKDAIDDAIEREYQRKYGY